VAQVAGTTVLLSSHQATCHVSESPSVTSPEASSSQFGAAVSWGQRSLRQPTGGQSSFEIGCQGTRAPPAAFYFGAGGAASASGGQQPSGFYFGSPQAAPGREFNFGTWVPAGPVQIGTG